ncbi:MAG: Elongation factor Ts [Parcubacteria group bacterium GW2011_GWA2_48_9]|nr:MAG: Elongation factor Ts [Parcubacteria group bacterium GW2011_GWA2_48_9]
MKISSEAIQALRAQTGAGMMDAKRALEEASGDIQKAIEHLRKAGKKVALTKADRTTHEGRVGEYTHINGKVAGLVAIACETDFVARTDEFIELAHNVAMHVVAMNPSYLDSSLVPQDIIDAEKVVYREQLEREGKPEAIREKIIDGKLRAYYREHCLVSQPFVKDDKKSVDDIVKEHIAKLGENIRIIGFSRLSL